MCVSRLKALIEIFCIKLHNRALLFFVCAIFSGFSVAQTPENVGLSQSPPAANVSGSALPSQTLNMQVEISSSPANPSSLAALSDTAGQSATPRKLAPKSAPSIGSGRHLMNVTLGLAAIVALIFALSWLVKRFSQGAFSGNQHLKIIASLPLGTRERLLLIDAAGESILLGVTATSITNLHHFKTPLPATHRSDLGEHKNSDFSQKLMELMRQKPSAADKTTSDNNAAT